MTFREIQIHFVTDVEISEEHQRKLVRLVGEICDSYKATHPGRTMWPFGIGLKMLSNPYMVGDDEPLQFDEHIFSIECSEREGYDWKCAKCGKPQGDHKHCITQPDAGDCDFEARSS